MVEAGGPSGWVSDLYEERDIPILVCRIHEDAWLFKYVKLKTDKDDAINLAELAALEPRVSPTDLLLEFDETRPINGLSPSP